MPKNSHYFEKLKHLPVIGEDQFQLEKFLFERLLVRESGESFFESIQKLKRFFEVFHLPTTIALKSNVASSKDVQILKKGLAFCELPQFLNLK
mgnify:CR=1 FL=1